LGAWIGHTRRRCDKEGVMLGRAMPLITKGET
jgi:hypothetical protein